MAEEIVTFEWPGLSTSVFLGEDKLPVSLGRSALVSHNSRKEEHSSTKDYILNGAGDNELKTMAELAEQSTVIMPGIRFNAGLQYAGGIVYGYRKVDGENEWFSPEAIPEVDEWLETNRIHMQLMCALIDMETFGFAVPQLVWSKDKTKIARLTTELTRAQWIRMERRDAQGNIPQVHLNADFGTGDYKEEGTSKLKIAPLYIDNDAIDKLRNTKSFGMILRVPDLGRQYYNRPDWMASVEAGWYDLSKAIAESKLFWMKNQFGIKYHIEFHPEYWLARYGRDTWNRLTDEEKKNKKSEEVDNIVKFLQGTDKQGATYFSEFLESKVGYENLVSLVKINELKNIVGDGHWMKESNESSDHMLSALGIHPELIGNAPGSKMGAGSGSANRVAFNQRVALSHFRQEELLSVMSLVKRINKWPSGLIFKMRNSLITTLDKGSEATKPKGELPAAE